MNYAELFTPHHIALLADWFYKRPELCAEIYQPHGGGSQSYYTVQSLRELKSRIPSFDNYLEIVITIWKNHTQVSSSRKNQELSFLIANGSTLMVPK
jgi:hypothetical protein